MKAAKHESLERICHFCDCVIAVDSEADEAELDALITPEWACYAAGCLDLADLFELENVCAACAERLVGADWLEKGRASLAQNEAFWKAVGSAPLPRPSQGVH